VLKPAALLVALLVFCAQQAPAPAPAIPATVRLGIARGSSYEITSLPLETYVARVLAGEAAAGSPPAALEALAITVRTFTAANLGRHRADDFDLCDQTHCQVLRPATADTERAAQATAGQVLVYRGALASVYYSASCGGFTERPSDVWPGAQDPAYLPSRRDEACQGEPAWTEDLSRADLTRALNAAGFRGIVRDARITDRDSSGRVARLALDGVSPAEISGQDLRTAVMRALGPLHMKSTAFDLRRSGDTFAFSGHGFGHGVGMCVIGSVKLAASGESAQAILARYFPGATIARPGGTPTTTRAVPAPFPTPAAPSRGGAPAGPAPAGNAAPRASTAAPATAAAGAAAPVISLPAGDEGEGQALSALVAAARDELVRETGVGAPARVSVRVHPTVDDYERATRQPWFTAGTVVNEEIHLVPMASLRARGVLDRTIRRELAHLLLDPPLAGRPAWVRFGAALYFSDPSRESVGGRAACPSDAELLSPVSAGALADAYARARGCFARQVQGGRAWKDVR
jgi:stage II sporulation protein D